ncbi:MAG: prephenate dehydratase [Rikenellaceae bacterium]
MKKIAIQGVAGCFHEQAARNYFAGEMIEPVECETFPKLFEVLEAEGSAKQLGIVAIENTIAGPLLQNHELLRNSKMQIVGEQRLRIELMAAALPESQIEDITEVNSHPIALMQCQAWLSQYPAMKVVEKDDTAASAQYIAENRLADHAAICSELAADMYGMKILARGVETNKRNFTRFLILAPEDVAATMVDKTSVDKASLVFTLADEAGELSKVLSILSFYGINMTKIQSMPLIGREWEYQFYIDVKFDNLERYRQAIEAVKPLMNYMKSLGEYKSFQE